MYFLKALEHFNCAQSSIGRLFVVLEELRSHHDGTGVNLVAAATTSISQCTYVPHLWYLFVSLSRLL